MATPLPNQLLRRSFVKTVLRRLIALITVVGLGYGLIAVIYATKTIFKVKMNYAVVLERFGGVRQAVTDVGWHARLPYFTRIEQEVPLMNQTMQLGGTPAPMRIISKGNVALWTSGVLTYRIRDLKTWAIENLSPLDLLQGDYDGIVKDILQSQEVDRLISDRETIKEDIFTALKSRPINIGGPTIEGKYGVEVVSFVLKETRFGDKLVEASEEKKRRELIAEADNYAADQEASRIRKLYAAYLQGIQDLQKAVGRKDGNSDNALFEFLTQQKWATAYEKHQLGQHTVVIQNTQGNTPAIALPAFNETNRSEGGNDGQTTD
ncbi:putative inner membrane protein, band 7 family [Desulfosarcina variabilis str. Montpellier]|uniref:SPFH domain-containing protein n=1 Tax=Desulfosarcina variabilis TaxID=2300 RepID=UPI003AFB114D